MEIGLLQIPRQEQGNFNIKKINSKEIRPTLFVYGLKTSWEMAAKHVQRYQHCMQVCFINIFHYIFSLQTNMHSYQKCW